MKQMMPARAAITRAGHARRINFRSLVRSSAGAGTGDVPLSMTGSTVGRLRGWLEGGESFMRSRQEASTHTSGYFGSLQTRVSASPVAETTLQGPLTAEPGLE